MGGVILGDTPVGLASMTQGFMHEEVGEKF